MDRPHKTYQSNVIFIIFLLKMVKNITLGVNEGVNVHP
jgi:hypothetical protein